MKFSGSFKSHYSPKDQVKLSGLAVPSKSFIALQKIITPSGAIRLASPIGANQYAAQIYSALGLGNAKGLKKIIAILPDGDGLEEGIFDWITKAGSEGVTQKLWTNKAFLKVILHINQFSDESRYNR